MLCMLSGAPLEADVQMLACMCTSYVSLSLFDGSGALFLPRVDSLVPNRCTLSCTITLRLHSLTPIALLFSPRPPPPSPAPCSDNLIMGPYALGAPPISSGCYTQGRNSFIRFLSVSFTLLSASPSSLPAFLSLSLVKPKPTWQITPLFHGVSPPTSLVICRRISLPPQQLEQSSATIKRPLIISQ